MFGFFDYDRLAFKTEKLAELYKVNSPFPHMVIDEIGSPFLMQKVEGSYKDAGERWHQYDNFFEKKQAMDSISKMGQLTQMLIHEMQSAPFIRFLEDMTGKTGLIADHTLRGAGMHQISRGGKLDIHADFNWHPKLKLNRSVNVLLYLNSNWQMEWGGQLELWDKDLSKCEKSIAPLFNRMVIFNSTDESYHGHPKELTCPEGTTRKSVAMYYYQSPVETKSDAHSTMFKKLPSDETTAEIETFREKRSRFQNYESTK